MLKSLNLTRIILAVLIIFIPLYPKFPLTNVTGTYVAIRLDDIIVAISGLIWFVSEAKKGFPTLKEPITKLFLAYYLAIFASFIAAVFIFQTDRQSLLLLHFLRRLEYSSLFFIAYSAVKSRTKLSPYYIVLFLSTVGIIAYGYGQKYFQFPVISTMNSEFSKGQWLVMDNWTRISSTFAGHYDLAAFLSVALIIIGGVIVTVKNRGVRILNIILWLFSFHLLTLTASRVSYFAFYGGMIFTLLLLKKLWWIVPVTLVFVFSIFSSKDLNQRLLATIPALKKQITISQTTPAPTVPAVTPTAAPTTPPIAGVKITPKPTVIRHGPVEEVIPIDADVGVARSGEIRFNAEWPRAITAFRKNVLLGTGLGSITLATDNDYLRALGESGVLGFTTLMVILLYFIVRSLRFIPWFNKNQSNLVPVIFLGALVTFLMNATLIDVFEASKTAYLFWIMMGIYYYSLGRKS